MNTCIKILETKLNSFSSSSSSSNSSSSSSSSSSTSSAITSTTGLTSSQYVNGSTSALVDNPHKMSEHSPQRKKSSLVSEKLETIKKLQSVSENKLETIQKLAKEILMDNRSL